MRREITVVLNGDTMGAGRHYVIGAVRRGPDEFSFHS